MLLDSLQNNLQFKNNIVVKIKDEYFSKYNPDSGLDIPLSHRLVDMVTVNPTQLDLRRAQTQLNTSTIKIDDRREGEGFSFTSFMGSDENALIGSEIIIYFGRVLEAMPFSEYIEIARYIISDIDQITNGYNIMAKSQEEKAIKKVFIQQATLNAAINDSVTTLETINDEDIFPAQGILKIDGEYINYLTKSFSAGITTFSDLSRGFLSSSTAEHAQNSQVFYVQELRGNPIDLVLQLLISSGGGGAYDVLIDGAGISNTLIDVAEFEAIKTNLFAGDIFTRYISNEESLLKFIEDEFLVTNNIRLIKNSTNNLISIAVLDQSNDEDVLEITDSIIVNNSPKWKISKNEMQTIVKVQWNWIEGLQKYTRSKVFKASQDVLDVFGEINGITLNLKGVQSADNGDTIAALRAQRFLSRFSTPKVVVKLNAYMPTFKHNIGDKILITSKDLPQQGGGLGMSSVLELLNRSVNLSTGIISMGFRFTSYTNIRSGLISPSPFLNLTIVNQKTFHVPDGTAYKVGYGLKLWDYVNKTYYPDAVNYISEIDGNIITMENDFTTTLTSNCVLFFADYDEASDEQRARYAFICDNTNFFLDGGKAYQVVI